MVNKIQTMQLHQSSNSKFIEDQVIKAKAKAKGTKLKHHVPRQVRVELGFCKVYQF
jgi:phosphopantetheine adenylyltransferase